MKKKITQERKKICGDIKGREGDGKVEITPISTSRRLPSTTRKVLLLFFYIFDKKYIFSHF